MRRRRPIPGPISLFLLASLLMLLANIISLRAQPPSVHQISLDDALKLASQGSEEVQIAQAGVTRATGNQEIARSQFLPQINLTAGYTRTLASQYSGLSTGSSSSSNSSGSDTSKGSSSGTSSLLSNLPFGKPNQYSLGITLSQTIFAGGGLVAQDEGANARRRSADIDVTSATAQLALNVVQSYYDAILSDRLVVIADSSLAQTQEILRQTELAYNLGEKAEFDMLRARVARDNQLPLLLQRRNDRALAYFRLKQLLNVPLQDSLVLTSGVTEASPQFANLSDTSADARAPVRQAVENVNASRAAVDAAEAQRWPNVSLVSRYAPVAYPSGVIPNLGDFRTDWTVGLNVSMPLFTGGRIGGNETVARGNVDEATARLRQAREAAALDAQVAINSLAQAEATMTSTASTAEQAQRAYSIAGLRFQEGISTQLDLADARLLLEQALANQAVAARNYQVARARLALLRDLPLGTGSGATAQGTTQQGGQSGGSAGQQSQSSQPQTPQTGGSVGATTGTTTP